ncbi:conserved exported hypothetical protein [Nostocoides japonicum T1-X7]|uniref:DUF58 domain-containing protein n=1 Tax=Nostocoides japonicum T1-X7 TaxID=1194083 RepID=A0A077M0X5_9MICO|nr:DUF58 domain-containing protein [Tetrasphaera japonica]CCH79983.1 conserved exported hypothetical protein [Tetrasphaera japonica T1-X7]
MALTPRALWLAVAGLVAFAAWPTMATVRWWWLAVVVVLLLDWLLAPRPQRLVIERYATPQVRLGASATSRVTVRNPGTRTVRGVLRDAWQPSAGASGTRHPLRVPGGERVLLTTPLTPTRRGDRLADRVTVRLSGPLGLAARQRSFDIPGRVRALHPFGARRHLASRLAMLRQLDGRSAVRTRGQGTEFDSLRDYVEGDDVRSIDWRATARRQNLVVRTWQPEQHRRVVLVLDTSRTSAGRVDDAPRLDASMDAALLLGALAAQAHDHVELVAGDRRIHARVAGSDRGPLLHDMVEAMSPIDASLVEADWELLASEVTGRGNRRGLVVLLTPLESAAVEEGLLPVLPALVAHHRVVVASVADSAVARMRGDRSGVAQVYDAAAAERTTALRRRTADALGLLGVTVIDAVPEELPVRLADHYLWLKAQGLL